MSSKKTVAGVPGKDPTLPNVPLELCGKTYHVCYDFNAIIAYEEQTGENILITFESEDIAPKKLRALLWAGLLKENPDLTLQQVGALIALSDMGRVVQAVAAAITGSKAEPDPNAKGEAAKA